MRVASHGGLLAERPNMLDGSVKVRAGFEMNAQEIGPSASKIIEVPIGIGDHEMHIQRRFRRRAHGLDHQWANCDVGNEMAVHDVDVNQVGAPLRNRPNLVRQPPEVGTKNRRSNERAHPSELKAKTEKPKAKS
jgi:hypothetical protein